MPRKRILVTGGAGFLGSHLCDRLAATDVEVICLDNFFTGSKRNVAHLLSSPCFEIVRHDVVEPILLEVDQIDVVKGYLDQAAERGVEIILPTDVVAATEFSADAEHGVVDAHSIPADRIGLDIGPASAAAFAAKLSDARTVFWNGPMGAFEMAPYAAGTLVVAQALVDITSKGALTVIGGGDSAAAVRQLGFADNQFGHISTGGGASLEYLEGKVLPGLTVLEG